MKSTHYLRMICLILISLIIIACGLFKPSDEIASLQSTIDALTSQQDTTQDNGEPPQPITTDDQTQATPEIEPTESSWQNALTYIDQYGGSTNSVAVKGDFAYMGQGPRMVVLDISNPGAPIFISESELLPGLVMGVEVDGDYAYVTTMFSGLNIFDISQANTPTLVSQVKPDRGGCGPLVIHEGIAYIACNTSGLFIVDVNDPLSPRVLSHDVFQDNGLSIAYHNNHVYFLSSSGGLVIINVSDPTNPQQVGYFDMETIPSVTTVNAEAIAVCQDDLCMAVGNHGFVILDLSNPANPTVKSSSTQFWASGVVSDGRYAYLIDDLEGVRVFDIANPSQPQQVGLMPTSVGGFEFSLQELTERGIYLANQILFIPDQAYGLITVDVSNPSQPARVGQYMTPIPDAIMGIKVVGDYAYAICRFAGFRVLDASDPENLAEIFFDDERKFLTLQVPNHIEVIGDYAYISDSNYPLHIYDISNPNQPDEVGIVDGGPAWDSADDLAIAGNFAYLSGRGGNDAIYPGAGIWVIDISNPTAPLPVKFVDLPNSHWSLSIHSTVLYALDGTQDYQDPDVLSLRVIDIRDPFQSELIQSIPIPELKPLSLTDIQVSGDWLFVGMAMDGIKLFDIGDPLNPVEVPLETDSGIMPVPMRLSLHDSILFVNGISAYDISDPTLIKLIGMGVLPMDAWDCDVAGDLVFMATKFQGVYVYRIHSSP
jgi:hypothetical protein